MAVLFIEPGTDATFDLKFYTSVTGTVTSDSGQAQTGPRSLKFDSGAGSSLSNVSIPIPAGPTLNTGQLSFAVRLPVLPGATLRLASIFSTVATFDLTVSSAGVLHFSSSGTPVGANGSSLSAGAWTHLAICWSITSTTLNTLTLFVGTTAAADITASNVTLFAATTPTVTLGLVAGAVGANFVVNIDDVYLTSDNNLTNPGDIRVTAKRPISLYEGGFDTAIGANPADRWTNVNERALSETNGWAQSATMQFGRPASDITVTGWTFTGGASAAAVTAEVTADDNTSYAERASTGTLEVKLGPLNDPLIATDHVISVRLETPDGASAVEKATLSLVEGTTVRASAPQITLTRGSYATVTYTLTSAEANAITDYTNLRLRVVVDTAGAAEHTRVTQLFMQVPQALALLPSETYQIQGWAAGDAGGDLTGTTIVGRTAWAWVKKTASAITGEGLWADGTLTAATFGTTSDFVTVTDAIDRYPLTDRAIGIRASSGDAVTSLYECGYLLAYLPATTTRLYLRLAATGSVPTAGDKSAALPSGTLLDTAPLDRALSLTRGAGEQALAWSSLGQTGAQSAYAGRFTSTGLNAQTIAANTWTITFVGVEGGANANAFLALSVYVWRPSTGAVVGYVYDSATALGTEWGTARSLQAAVSFTGAAVTAANGDVLVLEVWSVATQADTTSYSQNFYFDGGTGGTTTDVAAYVETPQVLSFGTVSAGTAQLFLRNRTAGQSPSANDKSTALPSGTQAISANGTGNERFDAAFAFGSSQVAITWSSLAQTAQQCAYLARFSSPALLAQTINAGTWTIAFGASASSASAASKIALSLYVWRPSTASVVGLLYDAVTGLGTVWPVSEAGIVATFTGAALAVAVGDLLVLEIWQVAVQTAATAFTNSFAFEGSTPPVQGTATSNPATNLTAPQTLNFQTYARLGVRLVMLPIKERDDG